MYDNRDARSEDFRDVARLREVVRLESLGFPESSRWDSKRGMRERREYCIVQSNSVLEP